MDTFLLRTIFVLQHGGIFCLYLCPLERSFMFDFFWLLVSFLLLLLNRRALKHVNGLCSHWPAICRSSQGAKTVPFHYSLDISHTFFFHAISLYLDTALLLEQKRLDPRIWKDWQYFDTLFSFDYLQLFLKQQVSLAAAHLALSTRLLPSPPYHTPNKAIFLLFNFIVFVLKVKRLEQ